MKGTFKLLIFDGVAALLLWFVTSDLQTRYNYATSEQLSVSYQYSLFLRTLTLSKGSLVLQSPPTIDWVQVMIAALIAVNGYFAISAYRRTRAVKATRPPVFSPP